MLIRSHEDLKKAFTELVNQLSKGPFHMDLLPVSPDKTKDQMRVWWKYLRKIEKEGGAGYKAEELNDLANERIIEPIYIGDNIPVVFKGSEIGYAEAYARVIQLLHEHSLSAHRAALKELQQTISKEKLSAAQMSRALEGLEIWAAHEFKVGLG